MARFRLIPVDDTVVFPGMDVTIAAEVDDERVLLVPRIDGEYATIGVVAEVVERVTLPRGREALVVRALHRGVPGQAVTDGEGELRVDVVEHPDEPPPRVRTAALETEYRAIVDEILELRGADERVAAFLRSISDAGQLADTAGYSPALGDADKLRLLETIDVEARLRLAVQLQREALAELQVRKRIRDDIEGETQKQQREFFLRKQMQSIRKELGDDEASVIEEYERRIAELDLPDAVREQAERELRRLERMGEDGGESQMIRTYLDWLLALPWGTYSSSALDPAAVRGALDADHAGLDDVKDRIEEYLAVQALRMARDAAATVHDDDAAAPTDAVPSQPTRRARRSGAILTLVGPPGTGKTSIGESVARALGRPFARIALGGVRDEAEIRGHRRTYIGAMPGRLARALRDAGSMNPVILLDEVDKLGADWRGDPSSALLEVLDPAQNHTFRDHYLDVELDLSDVFFIATGNVADTIPAPLLDRMEVIGFDGYTLDEKVAIAREHLLPRVLADAGLEPGDVVVEDPQLRTIVGEYTREAGVRQLERELRTIVRKAAAALVAGTKATPITVDDAGLRTALGKRRFWQEAAERTAVPGVATGLAVTGSGGDVLFVEATSMPGGREQLTLTGQLGDVMRESARIALSLLQSTAERHGIAPTAFERRAFHIHVPAGAIPKDGPSAGITMVTALASLLTGRAVRHEVGMTGEVTLRGKVLPIGGVKQKVLAAHAAGLTEIVLPERNRADLDEVPAPIREQMTFHLVLTVDEVLDLALEPAASAVRGSAA